MHEYRGLIALLMCEVPRQPDLAGLDPIARIMRVLDARRNGVGMTSTGRRTLVRRIRGLLLRWIMRPEARQRRWKQKRATPCCPSCVPS